MFFCWRTPEDLGAVLARFLRTAEQLVVIAPLPGHSDALASIVNAGMRVTRVDAFPGANTGTAQLFQYSRTGLFSLAPPTQALRQLFPGLLERGFVDAPQFGTGDLVNALPSMSDPLEIYVDMPGYEDGILTALDDAGFLDRARHLVVRCGADVFFEGALAADAIINRMQAVGYRLIAREPEDPYWPELVFECDQAARRCAALEAELSEHRATAEQAAAEHESLLVQARSEFEAAKNDLAARDGELSALRETLSAQLTEFRSRAEQASEERDAVKSDLAARDRELFTLSETLSAQDSALSAERKRLDDTRETLAEAQRCQRLAESDLQALRGKLADANRQRADYQALLEQLVPRLREAQSVLEEIAQSQQSGDGGAADAPGLMENALNSSRDKTKNKKNAGTGSKS